MTDREKLEALGALSQDWLRECVQLKGDAIVLYHSDNAVGAAELLAASEIRSEHYEAIREIIGRDFDW